MRMGGIHMRQLTMTGFCVIALLSGCTGGSVGTGGGVGTSGVGNEPQANDITLPCRGKDVNAGDWPIKRVQQTLHFHTDGRCKFTDLHFDPPNNPQPQNFKPPVADAGGKTISYDYDGSNIPTTGYAFKYTNDDPNDGNGSGVIK